MEGENGKRRLPEALQPVIFGKIIDSAVVLLHFFFFLKVISAKFGIFDCCRAMLTLGLLEKRWQSIIAVNVLRCDAGGHWRVWKSGCAAYQRGR